jgi:soluble lytic murein transglycosylase
MEMIKKIIPVLMLVVLSLACSAVNHLPFRQTPTPTVTPTATLTPTPTSTPTPTPTPTPLPAARVSQGDHALFNGDWDNALQEYRTALGDNPDPEVQTAALIGIGHTYYLAGDYETAIETLQAVIDENPSPVHQSQAYFFLAQSYSALDRHLEAADAYRSYLEARPDVIDAYVHEDIGDELFIGGDYAGAIVEYQAALEAPRLAADLGIDTKIAQSYALLGDYKTAIIGYQDIYDRTSNDYIKAQMDLWMGQAYAQLGQMEEANRAYLDAVDNYPLSGDSYTALVTLVDNGVPVNEFNRGLVDYYAGQYGVALAAFDRYLQGQPDDPAAGYYYKGLTLVALGQYRDAIEDLNRVIRDYPDSSKWTDAWEQKAFTQWFHLDQYTQAAKTLTDFVKTAPQDARAAEMLFDAGRIHERAGRLQRAAQVWEQVGLEFPSSDHAYRAMFLAGIANYRLGKYAEANAFFQRDLPLARDLGERAALFFWSGKCSQALDEADAARNAWEQAASLDPTGYYSERARDLLQGQAPFEAPEDYVLSFDIQAERAEAEAWMGTVFSLPESTDLSGPGTLADDPRFQRGTELWRLGLYDQARSEFEDLRKVVQSDSVNSYRLANYLIDLGLYRSGIFAARQVLTLAGMDDAETMKAPIYFNHLRFGTYYRDLVIPLAQTYDFHPLFLFSVMRQESLFEGFVRSVAGARGLMQIVPSTGAEIVDQIQWPENYSGADLYRPLVSLTLGVEYLNRQLIFLDGDIYAALAAYNGGPGNARTWKGMAPDDPDLFLEIIPFDETRSYIQGIYEVFNIYREIYQLVP